jgi:Skp family chaperone for outer membrane proteins
MQAPNISSAEPQALAPSFGEVLIEEYKSTVLALTDELHHRQAVIASLNQDVDRLKSQLDAARALMLQKDEAARQAEAEFAALKAKHEAEAKAFLDASDSIERSQAEASSALRVAQDAMKLIYDTPTKQALVSIVSDEVRNVMKSTSDTPEDEIILAFGNASRSAAVKSKCRNVVSQFVKWQDSIIALFEIAAVSCSDLKGTKQMAAYQVEHKYLRGYMFELSKATRSTAIQDALSSLYRRLDDITGKLFDCNERILLSFLDGLHPKVTDFFLGRLRRYLFDQGLSCSLIWETDDPAGCEVSATALSLALCATIRASTGWLFSSHAANKANDSFVEHFETALELMCEQ